MRLIEVLLAAAAAGTVVAVATPTLLAATAEANSGVVETNIDTYSRLLMVELLEQPPTPEGLRTAASAVTEYPGIAGQLSVGRIDNERVTFEVAGRGSIPAFSFCVDASTGTAC